MLSNEIISLLNTHIKENTARNKIYLDSIHGHKQHMHGLISLNATQSIAWVMQNIKGESSRWINNQKLLNNKFQWQKEYYAVSIGQSMVGPVRKYIANQPEHHRRKSFNEEVDEFMEKYGFRLIRG